MKNKFSLIGKVIQSEINSLKKLKNSLNKDFDKLYIQLLNVRKLYFQVLVSQELYQKKLLPHFLH